MDLLRQRDKEKEKGRREDGKRVGEEREGGKELEGKSERKSLKF